MRKYFFWAIPALLLLVLLIFYNRKLTKEKAKEILIKAYKKNDQPDADGGARTTINYLSIDSIHQKADTATVFYQINGIIENGSKYPKSFGGGEEEAHFKRSISGWQSE